MSHWAEVEITLKDMYCVKDTLKELGYTYKEGTHKIKDWASSEKEVDLSVNDRIGFKQEGDTIKVIADFYGTGISQTEFIQNLNQVYAKNKIVKEVSAQGFNVASQEKDTKGNIQLVLQRW